MQQVIIRLALALMVLCGVGTVHATERTRGAYWPVHSYVAADSVLGRYYRQFVERYGHAYEGPTETFQGFCLRLRASDLLSDQFTRMGIPSRQIQGILRELATTHLATTERQHIRQNMLAIDLALETIEGGITLKSRAEFRREVLAEIPPITSTG